MFPKRFVTAACPEYPELVFKLLANPSGELYQALLDGNTATKESKHALGSALAEAYAGGRYEGYGVTLDFSTAENAILAVTNLTLPIDLRQWIRNAPIDIVTHFREELEKNWPRSLVNGS